MSPPTTDWQPIETVPKDEGSVVDLWIVNRDGDRIVGQYRVADAKRERGFWLCASTAFAEGINGHGHIAKATHWVVPSPPESTDGQS